MRVILLVVIIVFSFSIKAQDVVPDVKKPSKAEKIEDPERVKNGVHFSLFGLGGFIATNYEHYFYTGKSSFFSLGAGFGTFLEGFTTSHVLTFNIGERNHFVEFGAGGVYMQDVEKGYALTSVANYRSQNIWGGFYFKAGAVITILKSNSGMFVVPFQLSAGYSF